MTYEELPKNIATRIEVDPGGCWLWTGFVGGNGYGSFTVWRVGTIWAHRMVYERVVGPIPEGLELDHLCRVRRCVNPQHLEPVTRRENARRGESPAGLKARQTHCKRGHEFTEQNTRRDKYGNRSCRSCDAARKRSQRRGEVFA